ncbi:hypothetical protein [Paraburkholderia youngii]|uniref:hypothetical protein n=1 Tax=Paraburkholderia youngii TaxID=2782701 RepID=UPI003D1BE2A2
MRNLTHDALTTQLTFRVAFRATDYLHTESLDNWREFRDRLHNGYPVSGVGIRATRRSLRIVDGEAGGFLHENEDIDPEDATGELPWFPYEAASAAYSFTLLEGFGNELCEIVNPGYLKNRQAWHHGIYGDTDLADKTQLKKARDAFVKPFGCKVDRAKQYAVRRVIDIKRERNSFMHEAEVDVRFEDFHNKVLATIASLYFLVLPSGRELSVYPYYDFHGKWGTET